MHRCVDGTRDVTYCHCCAWIFSYAGFICAIHIRRKRSIDRSVKRPDFMVALWREVEDSQAFLLRYSIARIDKCKSWFSSNRSTGLFRKSWMSHEMFYISYKMILLHLPRWMDRELNVLHVPCVQWQCWWGAFYVTLPYPFVVSCQNTKRNLQIFRSCPCWASTFSHSSHIW